jgi:hypothetical protein
MVEYNDRQHPWQTNSEQPVSEPKIEYDSEFQPEPQSWQNTFYNYYNWIN